MLNSCPACGGTISLQATSCPHCGHPLTTGATPSKQPRSPVFTVLAVLGFVLCLFTPRLILVLPLFGTVACAVVALFRKERGKVAAITVLVFTAGLLYFNESGTSSLSSQTDTEALKSVKLEDWNWSPDPTFASDGAIVWNASVRNLGDKYIENVEVTITTYDAAGKLITTDTMYVGSIPPGETRSDKGYADYYGTESNVDAKITEVRFAR